MLIWTLWRHCNQDLQLQMVDNSPIGWKEGDGDLIWRGDPFWHVNEETCISIFNQVLETSSNWHLEQRFILVPVPGGICNFFCVWVLPVWSFRAGWEAALVSAVAEGSESLLRHVVPAFCLHPLCLGLQTGSLMFSIPGKLQTLLQAFMSCSECRS